MLDKKYNKALTVILIIVVIAIFVILGFWGYDVYRKYYINNGANEALQEFDNRIASRNNTATNNTSNDIVESNVSLNIDVNDVETTTNTISSDGKIAKQTYKGYTVVGKIEIPSIKLSYPVLNVASKPSMEVSVGVMYGPGLNQVGNTVIAGHNYRNGTFFSNLKNVNNGDLIYITDESGNRVKYTIYNKYTTGSSEFDYATRDTAGKREISLTTCTNDVQARLVVWANED